MLYLGRFPYIDSTVVEVDDVVYTLAAGTVLRNEVGVIEYTGGAAIAGFLNNGDQVFDIVANADNRISSFKYVAAAADRTAAKAVIDMIEALDPEEATYAADIEVARYAYDSTAVTLGQDVSGITPLTAGAQRNLVTNLAVLVAHEDAEAFRAAHTTILGKTVATVAIGDQGALTAAVTAYNAETAASKALLADEKALMDDLQDKIDELVAAQAQTDADAFKADAAVAPILAKTVDTISAADDVDAAIAKHTALSPEAKALVTAEKALLDSLKLRGDAIKLVNTKVAAPGPGNADLKAALLDTKLGLDLSAYNALPLESLRTQVIVDFVAAYGATTFTDTASVQAALDALL